MDECKPLLIGSMLPYWFSAMTMKSVGVAAMVGRCSLILSNPP